MPGRTHPAEAQDGKWMLGAALSPSSCSYFRPTQGFCFCGPSTLPEGCAMQGARGCHAAHTGVLALEPSNQMVWVGRELKAHLHPLLWVGTRSTGPGSSRSHPAGFEPFPPESTSPSPRLPPHSERERGSRFPIYFYLVDHMLCNVKCSVEEEISATAG